jgi:DNA invertase Pin-like site-specific DNA recombinase
VPPTTAIYVRVSSRTQDTASQEPDLRRWVAALKGTPVRWYRDKFTGLTMNRPGFGKLLADVHLGKVARVVVWRLDRLGRTARGLTELFEDLLKHGVPLVSLKEGFDLETSAGRLLAHVLTSVAVFETEVRSERIVAGQAAARAAGRRWGGSPKGRRLKVTDEQEAVIRRMRGQGEGVTAIARATGLSRPTVYRVLGTEAGSGMRPRNRPKPRPRKGTSGAKGKKARSGAKGKKAKSVPSSG